MQQTENQVSNVSSPLNRLLHLLLHAWGMVLIICTLYIGIAISRIQMELVYTNARSGKILVSL